MRLAGTLETRQHAELLADYLLAEGVRCKVEPSGEAWALWIREEDHFPRAMREMETFRANPDDPRYREAQQRADEVRRNEARREQEYRRNLIQVGKRWQPMTGPAPLTYALIAVSIVATIWTWWGTDVENFLQLTIAVEPADWEQPGTILPEVRAGELWRLVTPIFVHLHVLHLLFNMWWLRDLGREIELRRSALHLAVLVLAAALIPNVAQYIDKGPYFGGMSGVVYGLFGYVWMKSKLEPASGLTLRPEAVFIMLLWLVLCMTGAVGRIANTAHVAGLVVGIIFGVRGYLWRQIRMSIRG